MLKFEKMYRDFIFQREGAFLELYPEGYITWKPEQDGGKYLMDIYCDPDFRSTGAIYRNYLKLEKKFKLEDTKVLYSSVDVTDPNSTQMLQYMFRVNYKIYANSGDLIYVKKEI